MELNNKKMFITGGSAGIGKSIIKELSEKEVSEVAVMGRTARKLDELETDFPSLRFLKIQGDVSKRSDVKNAAGIIEEEWGALDVLVNNAGVVSAGRLEDISDEDIIAQVNVNVTGLILLTKYLLPMLKKSSEGALINISSGLGYIAMPFYSVYAATKAAVKHFSEAMRRELTSYPLHVMTVYPTATDTGMMETAGVEEMDSPEEVAQATIEGLLNEEIEVVLGGEERKKMIQKNREEPLAVDKKVEDIFSSLQERAEHHRSM